MKEYATVGGVIELEVLRANGSIEKFGKIHNVVGKAAWSPSARLPFNGGSSAYDGTPNWGTFSVRGSENLVGSFSQSGTTVTRDAGTSSLLSLANGDMIVFASGERAYKTASISATQCTVSKSQTVPSTNAVWHKTNTNGYGTNCQTGAIQVLGTPFYSVTTSYSNGVLTNTLVSPRLFPVVTSAYTLRCISAGIYMAANGLQYGSWYDVPVDIVLDVGDQLIVASWVYNITWDAYTPRAFAASPLTGASGSGVHQRLYRACDDQNYQNATRIWLLSNANKITIPSMIGIAGAVVNPATFVPIETITATTTSATNPDYSNNNVASNTVVGTVVTGGTVKQIIWGTPSYAHGVIEYDTPISIAAGKVITLNPSVRMDVDLPSLPTPSWMADAYDYFLTTNWTTASGPPDTVGTSIASWSGSKGLMSSTVGPGVNDTKTGKGTTRRSWGPKGNLTMTGHPTGSIGLMFAFKRTDTNYCRMVNYGDYTQGWYLLNPGDGAVRLDGYGGGHAGVSSALAAETGGIYDWHSIAIKYSTTTGFAPIVWVNGVQLTGAAIATTAHSIMKRFGDGGLYDGFELGDFAIYTNPTDANMAIYGTQLAAKWKAA